MRVAQTTVRGRRDGGGPGRSDHLHAHGLDGHGQRCHAGGRRGGRARATGPDFVAAEGPRLQDQVQGRPGGPRGHPSDQLRARSGVAGGSAGRRTSFDSTASSGSARSPRRWLPRSSRRPPWSCRPVATACARAPRGRCSKASPASTPRAATTTRRRTQRASCRRCARETPPTSWTSRPRSTSPSRRRATRRRRSSRPSRRTASAGPPRTRRRSRTIVDRGYVTVQGTPAASRGRSARSSRTCWWSTSASSWTCQFTARMEEELDEVARGERDVGAAPARVLRPAQGTGRREARASCDAATSRPRRRTRSAREGHPMVIRLGRNGRFLACSLYPEHKETRPLPGEEPEAVAVEGVGETCPDVRAGDARREARPLRSLRGLLPLPRTATTSARTGPPPPAAARASRSTCPKCGQGQLHGAPRPPHGLRLLGLLALPEVRLHHLARAARPAPRRGRGPRGAQRRGRHLPALRRGGGAAEESSSWVRGCPAGPPNPGALARGVAAGGRVRGSAKGKAPRRPAADRAARAAARRARANAA